MYVAIVRLMVNSSSQTLGDHWLKFQAGTTIAALGVIQGSVPLLRSTRH
jgi:hypothetical protein